MKILLLLLISTILLSITIFAQSNVVYVYPQSADYWTGTTDSLTKTDPCEIRAMNNEVGWMMFDVSSVPQNTVIDSVTLWAYISTFVFPHLSVTPLPYNGVTASASDIFAGIRARQVQDSAYVYIDEWSTFTTGWFEWTLTGQANNNLHDALSQGWFSLGIASRDNPPLGLIIDGWCSFNPPYLVVYYSPLPVELTSFTAQYKSGKVILIWKTATEKNNRGFEIQRKQKGYDNNWEVIGFVEGNGTTTNLHNYTFTDNNISSSGYLYRLKQVDYDGSFEYSEVKEVSINAPSEFSLMQNYPNPFNPSTKIKYTILHDKLVTLKVYDMMGQEVTTLVNEQKSAGFYEINFDAQNFASGIYFYRLQAGSFIQTRKMILTK